MAIYPHKNLLGCRTVQDWTVVKEELPQLFDDRRRLNAKRRDAVIYFALQKTALFHVCIASYKGQYRLLHGTQELLALLDFILYGAPLTRNTWTLPLPFPGDGEQCTFSSLSMQMREQLLATRIPHCDVSVGTIGELECLSSYYSDGIGISDSICLPML